MKHIREIEPLLKRFMDMLEKQLGKNCEIVLHDHTKEFDHTIVDIRNGHVTGREVGGFGSNMGLEILRGTDEGGDRYNYVTYTNNGKILRSSTLHFWDEDHKMIGALCINLDITDGVKFENYLREHNNYNTGNGAPGDSERVDEIFVSDVQQLLDELIRRAFAMIGKPASEMSREEKMRVVSYLDEKGAFIITKSGERIEEALGISKYTFYNYLEAARKTRGKDRELAEQSSGEKHR